MKPKHYVMMGGFTFFAILAVLFFLEVWPRSYIPGITTDMTRADVEAAFERKPYATRETNEYGYQMDCWFALGSDKFARVRFNQSGRVVSAFHCDRNDFDLNATQRLWLKVRRVWQ